MEEHSMICGGCSRLLFLVKYRTTPVYLRGSVSETLLYCCKWIIYEEKRLLMVLEAGRSPIKG